MHNLLTTSVHNLMTLTVHEVLTLYTNYADNQYQQPLFRRRLRKLLEKLGVDSPEQLDMIPADRVAAVVADGRRRVVSEFAPIDFDAALRARTGRKKIALNVLWMNYVDSVAACGLKPYSYERFRQLVANEVGVRGLTARIVHFPGRTMQVDWSGTKTPGC